jgi:hypothetical protein
LDVFDEAVQSTVVHAAGHASEPVAEVLGVAPEVAGLVGVAGGERPQAAGELVDGSGGPAGPIGCLPADGGAGLVGQVVGLGARLRHDGRRLATGVAGDVSHLVPGSCGDIGRPVLGGAIVGDRLVCHGSTSSLRAERHLPRVPVPNRKPARNL